MVWGGGGRRGTELKERGEENKERRLWMGIGRKVLECELEEDFRGI